MARRIIFKEDGLSSFGETSNGFRFLGYDGTTISEKFGVTISAIGGTGGSAQDLIITTTLSNALISASNSTLEPGVLYHITDAASSLYGGTEIVLRAISSSELDDRGMGKFYNPIYSGTDNGVWNNINWFNATSVTGTFSRGETITANNGAVGVLIGLVNKPNSFTYQSYFTVTSGTWTTATSITGNTTGSTASISGVTVQSYSVGNKVKWGGKVWQNLTGAVGSSVDKYTLDGTNWSEISYNETDYVVTWDEITYDITNDFITSRRDNLGNVVEQSYDNYNSLSGYIAIKDFQWGNSNIISNHCIESLFETINHKGGSIESNMITGGSYIEANTFGRGFVMYNCTFSEYSWLYDCFFFRPTSTTGFYYSTFKNTSFIQDSEFTNSCQFSQCELSSATLSQLSISNFWFLDSYFRSSGITNLRLFNTGLGTVIFQSNKNVGKYLRFSNSGTTAADVYINKNLTGLDVHTTVSGGSITFTTSSTLIWSTGTKRIYERSDGTFGISYLNGSDVVQYANATF